MEKITEKCISEILGFQIPAEVKSKLEDFNLIYASLEKSERDICILNILKTLDNDLVKTGKHRFDEWNKGWEENLHLYEETNDVKTLIPKYHGKFNIIRWKSDFIKSEVDLFDYKLHICLVDSILLNYIGENENIFEFGCGPGYHLLRLGKYQKNLNLFGCDWALSSQKILNSINTKENSNIKAINFDFYNPNYDIFVPENSIFYTIAALEQISDKYFDFIDFILDKKPNLVINMEPISELLDDTNLIDHLSIKYFEKRNYLKNFLPYLEHLESIGKVEIIKKQRIYYGSMFVEGHSLIVWRPI